MNDKNNKQEKNRSRTLLYLIALSILFAYGFQVTQIDLDEPLKPKRQENLISLIRELAKPDFFSYENETRSTNVSIRMPCPEEKKGSQVTFEGRLVLMAPNCATTTQDPINLSGEGFPANVRGAILWHPFGSTTTRRLTEFKTDQNGTFSVNFTMPDIRETEEPQRIEVVEVLRSRIVGVSDTTIIALDKILETILMALMASTIGTLIAIPISFMAARNLMQDVKLPLAAIMASILLASLGAGLGWWITDQFVQLTVKISDGLLYLGLLVLLIGMIWVIIRNSNRLQSGRVSWAIILVGGLFILGFAVLGRLGLMVGEWLNANLGAFGFLGNFIQVLSDLNLLLLPVIIGFLGALLGISLGGRLGQNIITRLAETPARLLTIPLTFAGTSILIIGIIFAVLWINLLDLSKFFPETLGGQLRVLAIPAIAIGLIVAFAMYFTPPKRHYAIGITIYTLVRGTLNILRSIEPIMMGFVFVVWVGLGPFAGILALTLHSVADLGKLFSEQVENIDEGPREAITATGANAVQSVVFGVVPQITPHYIAYIFYRWDINVRMSTIIGFVGGGGIGFVLQRFLNQLLYAEASVLVIAIAIVVTVLDYVSSRIRRRII